MEKMVVLNHKSCLTYDEVKNYIKNIKDYNIKFLKMKYLLNYYDI